ncbi:MAG TPA: AAA family ATPase, partial [Terriglobales bacterium]|nr:AAA family ATPase [Terriglobales bacterium]
MSALSPRSNLNILAVASKALQEKINTAVNKSPSRKIHVTYALENDLETQLKKKLPDYLILEFSDGVNDQIDKFSQKYPGLDIVVLLSTRQLGKANQLLLAGARAFVPVPFTSDEFIESFVRLDELSERLRPKDPAANTPAEEDARKMLVVFSPRGGVGCTTIAVNLALALQKTKSRTLLVDGNSHFGHMDMALNIQPKTTMSDLLVHIDNLDVRLAENVVTKHASGLNVLLNPPTVEETQAIQPDQIYKIGTTLQSGFGPILVDCGDNLDDKTVTWMDMSQNVLLVFSPNLTDLRDVRRFLEFIRVLNISVDKFLPVLSKAGQRGALSQDEVETALGMQMFATVPYDEATVTRAMNRGVPLYLSDPRSGLGKSFEAFSKKLAKVIEKEATSQEDSKGDRKDILATSSRLG